ncbi:bifunctional DNA-formamidopyrimidine glycosylase/DNA-(apurinic or apyrimidinic site) lyase [Gemmata sp.]|uniref:bifunctional DNA-formamidopyrimidine glycosylase/DNA-(apurinic or apyrimidinic site) lyase n=1 Tax=Gemmata sp. TaxID=1914242 RepID=UPI003F708C5C
MPELPEVETVVRDLRPLLAGRTVVGVRHSAKKLRRPWRPAWNARVTGATVAGVRRRGKWILVDLLDAKRNPPVADAPGSPVLRVHLGMTGQFTVVPAATPEPDHLHLAFALDNGTDLLLRDPRRFGSAEWFASRAALEDEMNAELGPEPFGLDAAAFRDAVTGTARNLKAVLLDQTIVAGVGNIYADEALFRSKLHPARTGKSLAADECDRLRLAVEAVLTKAIASRGSTIRDYVGGSGLRGGFQNEFAVYGRTGEPCPTCTGAIACERLAGRSSHFCASCQKSSPQSKTKKATKARTV